MGADDETRLINYVITHRDDLALPDEPFLIVMSSKFTSGSTAYNNRQNKVREERCGARLVYWCAAHLSAAALAIEAARLAPHGARATPMGGLPRAWSAFRNDRHLRP